MKNWRLLSLCLGLLLAVSIVGCGDDDDDNGNGGGNGGGNDGAAPAVEDAGEDAAVAEDAGPVAPKAVAVKIDDKSVDVTLAKLAKSKINGKSVVLISTIIDKSKISADLTTMLMDFEGSDGFRPSTKSFCADALPISAANADKVGVDLANDNTLVWDSSLDMAKCANVKYLAAIYLVDAAVKVNGQSIAVTFSDWSTDKLNGKDVVLMSTVIDSLGVKVTLKDVTLDFEGSDGFRPSEMQECASFLPTAGANADKVGVDTADANTLVWDDSLNAPGCAAVKNVAKIYIENK